MTASSDALAPTGPLAGLRVLDISTVVAGPFASALLGDLGAEVLKVEMPGAGDALRRLAPHKDGIPLWWKVTNRNKKGITGTLDEWGITRTWLQAINPRLSILRVTGFGQTGPYRNNPGFARVFEAMSGFTRMCGEEGGTPLHLGYPISDAIGGLFGAIGVLADLQRLKNDPSARGQEIDCSVTEAMMRTLDFLAIEYDQLGAVRTQSGNRSQYAAPGNIYATSDGKWASIAASTQSIFERFCAALGLQHLLSDPRFADNPARVKNWQAIDEIARQAISRLTLDELRTRPMRRWD
jgi:crotonobetainyl-CoA:carnitine CoA-transferase CaiB-like acyl-CoA transferase